MNFSIWRAFIRIRGVWLSRLFAAVLAISAFGPNTEKPSRIGTLSQRGTPFSPSGRSSLDRSTNLKPAETLELASKASNQVENPNRVDEQRLSVALAERMVRVPEFRFIRREAEKLGVKVYLFGGTASGYAHYVRWDLLREGGDRRFQPDRFDYDFTNIYRSNQDLDIVVDGSKDAIARLQQTLQETYPHFQGSTDAWEVRSLRENLSDTKMALLNNFDFLNQNSDSNSTGLIEITRSGDQPVRDLFNWDAENSQYLRDVAEGKIRYFNNPNHFRTARAKEGRNPLILSAIRYLAKVVQFDLEVHTEDFEIVKKIIRDFNPRQETNSYVRKKLAQFGMKVIQNAVNIEYAFELIHQLGLKPKLEPLSKGGVESIGWWLNRKPLTSSPVGRGFGKTARELGLTVVAHETRDFLAYESMTRAHTGAPNVLVSQQGFEGEKAAYGEGFYTKEGMEGARGTGITIRFQIHPDAREGTDFTRVREKGFVIFHNKNALRVIPESLRLGFAEYFHFLQSGSIQSSDRGAMEKLRRRIYNQSEISQIDPKDLQEVLGLLQKDLHVEFRDGGLRPIECVWFQLRPAEMYPEILSSILDRLAHHYTREGLERVAGSLTGPGWIRHEQIIARFIEMAAPYPDALALIAKNLLSNPVWSQKPQLTERLIQLALSHNLHTLGRVLDSIDWKDHTEFLKSYIERNGKKLNIELARNVLKHPKWVRHPELIQLYIEKAYSGEHYAMMAIFSEPHWAMNPDLMLKVIENHPEFVTNGPTLESLYKNPFWLGNPRIRKAFGGKEGFRFDLARFKSHVSEPEFLGLLLKSVRSQADLDQINSWVLDSDADEGRWWRKQRKVKEALRFLRSTLPWWKAALVLSANAENLKAAVDAGFSFGNEYERMSGGLRCENVLRY